MKKILRVGLVSVISAAALLTAGCENKSAQAKDGFRQYGINCLNDGKYEEAIDAFQKALDQSVGSVSDMDIDICYYKAQAQFLSGKYEEALDTYTAVINYNSAPEAYYLRGSLYYKTGVEVSEGQGARDYEEALKRDPDNYELYIGIYETLTSVSSQSYVISMVSVVQTDEEIAAYLEKALKIKGDDPKDHMAKGRIYYLLGDMEEAQKLLKQAVEEGLEEANYYLTQVYDRQGDTENSQAAFQKYLDSGSVDSNGLYEIGMTMMSAGDYERAVSCFSTALELENVTNKQALMKGRILAYEYAGDFSSAKSFMKEYLSAYPEDESMEKESIFLETR